MAAPAYSTDLTTLDDADSATNWAESTDANWDDGSGGPDADAEYGFIQGANGISQQMTKATICSLLADNGSDTGGHGTDGAFLVWMLHTSPNVLDTYANGGMRIMVGSSLADFYSWDVGGSDVTPNPKGGWRCYAANTTVTPDDTVGTPTSSQRYVGSGLKVLNGISKGNVHVVDAIRYGRCELRVNGGDLTNGYATFAGMAAKNDANNATDGYNRWGLFEDISSGSGIYSWKGRMRLGYSSAVDFRDSDATVLIENTPKCTAAFNKIDVEQSGSKVEWTNVTFIALGTTSKGRFEALADAVITLDGCKFVDMDTFIFDSNSALTDTVFQRCAQVTLGNGTFDGCLFEESTAASAVSAASPAEAAKITNSDFVSDGTGHGITIGGTAANITLTNVSFSGYAASDGSSGDEAIYVNIASGSMNITISGGSTPSIRTAGCVVNVVTSARTVKVKTTTTAGVVITSANVFLRTKTGGTGPFPANVTVTIVNSGNTATVTHTAHGMATNDYVLISGASLDANNGVFQITKISNDSYSYTMATSPGSSPTGTIKCWFVFLKGTTDGSGEISMSRSIPSNQDVEGWSAKASASPYYKNGIISGTVSSSGDTTFGAVMASDE